MKNKFYIAEFDAAEGNAEKETRHRRPKFGRRSLSVLPLNSAGNHPISKEIHTPCSMRNAS